MDKLPEDYDRYGEYLGITHVIESGYPLIYCIMELHGLNTSAIECHEEFRRESLAAFIQARLDTWKIISNSASCHLVDLSVKCLAEAVLNEYKRSLNG